MPHLPFTFVKFKCIRMNIFFILFAFNLFNQFPFGPIHFREKAYLPQNSHEFWSPQDDLQVAGTHDTLGNPQLRTVPHLWLTLSPSSIVCTISACSTL